MGKFSSIADSILGSSPSGGQPTKTITSPPFSGPGSGAAPPEIPTVIKANDDRREVCIDLPGFIQRAQYKQYLGQAAGAVGSTTNYAYAISDQVPQGKYWVVLYASAAIIGSNTKAFAGLWLIPPSAYSLLAPNAAAFQDNPQFFMDLEPAPGDIANGPPVIQGIRVDDSTINDSGNEKYSDVALLRTRKLIVPPGWSLLAYGGGEGFGNGGGLAEQYRLSIMFAEFLTSEDTEIQ